MSGQFLTNGRWADYPQGYVFNTEIYCPSCIMEMFQGQAEWATTEEVLQATAVLRGIDYSDEYSYDSDEFPKAITNGAGDGDHCASCMLSLEEV